MKEEKSVLYPGKINVGKGNVKSCQQTNTNTYKGSLALTQWFNVVNGGCLKDFPGYYLARNPTSTKQLNIVELK